MYKYYHLIILILSLYFIQCNDNSNPVKVEKDIKLINYCTIQGLEIEFSDTCSYKFITTFLSNIDSILVTETLLGSTFYLYADSADNNYWLEYFEKDSTIQSIITYNTADSIILKIELSGKKSIEEEKQRFLGIKHLKIIIIEEHPKLVYIDVPENTESEWVAFFKQYSFISHVNIIGICVLS
jgi:hypothetical protein